MKVLIVEDETAAFEDIVQTLNEINSDIEIVGNTESIKQTVKWLRSNPSPDIILMDIHLSDGSAFSIFDTIDVETPIIFTTAYDEYAINAFKVNSVDYLLKPIKAEELSKALAKFGKWTRTDVVDYLSRLTKLAPTSNYKDRILIPVKDKLIPIDLSEVSFFYTSDKNTKIYMKDGQSYPYSKTLEQIDITLNPADFYRANKQFIISRKSVKNITIWFDKRLLITPDIEAPERIYISKNKAAEFKMWVVNE